MAFFNTNFPFHSIAIAGLFCAWVALYSLYLINHDIPANPGGFYLESARQLAQNRFLIPEYVQGFGLNGIPFVYPPLAFYVLAVMGYLLGGILKAALYIPGILLLIQAILMYFFMKRWTGSKQASLWTAMVLLLVPQLFFRTIFADGITTGLSGIFMLASWIIAIKPRNKSNTYRKSIVGGVFVGLSILSHPALGLFCSVSFVILYLYRNGFNIKAIKGLFSSGITAFLVILPWLLAVISLHGIAPLLAGLHSSPINSGSNIIVNIEFTLSYMYSKNIMESQTATMIFWVFPFILAIIYNVIYGPRILILLLLAGIAIDGGNPSVSMFVFAASIGLLFDRILIPSLSRINLQTTGRVNVEDTIIGNWQFLAFFAVYLSVLFLSVLPFTSQLPFSPGEKETYDWIRVNTEKGSTFLMEGDEEPLVFFGQRTILLPILGAEWIPNPEYGNGGARDRFINGEIYKCRDFEYLISIFTKYNLAPDYMIYQISDDSERSWVEKLGNSCLFNIAYESGNFVTLRKSVGYTNCSWGTP